MRANDIIDATLSDWHTVDVATLADDTFAQLDEAEIVRLARRAYADTWRAALRAKDENGVPKFASVEAEQSDGTKVRFYKQTALFTVSDFHVAIDYHRAEAAAHIRTARALAKACNGAHGTDIPLPGLELTA